MGGRDGWYQKSSACVCMVGCMCMTAARTPPIPHPPTLHTHLQNMAGVLRWGAQIGVPSPPRKTRPTYWTHMLQSPRPWPCVGAADTTHEVYRNVVFFAWRGDNRGYSHHPVCGVRVGCALESVYFGGGRGVGCVACVWGICAHSCTH